MRDHIFFCEGKDDLELLSKALETGEFFDQSDQYHFNLANYQQTPGPLQSSKIDDFVDYIEKKCFIKSENGKENLKKLHGVIKTCYRRQVRPVVFFDKDDGDITLHKELGHKFRSNFNNCQSVEYDLKKENKFLACYELEVNFPGFQIVSEFIGVKNGRIEDIMDTLDENSPEELGINEEFATDLCNLIS